MFWDRLKTSFVAMPLVRCFKANVIVLALINASLAAAAPEASDPDVAAAYYGVDD